MRSAPRRVHRSLGCALLAAALLGAAAGPASADEKEFTLALQPGFAVARLGDRNAWGGGGGLDLLYGITDALSLRLTGAYSAHSLAAVDKTDSTPALPGGLVTAFHAGAGVSYAVDIVRLVPYFDLSIGLLGMRQPTDKGDKTGYDFGVEIGVGADYLINRRVAVGFVVRYHAYLTAITDIPVYLYAGPRVAFRFGG